MKTSLPARLVAASALLAASLAFAASAQNSPANAEQEHRHGAAAGSPAQPARAAKTDPDHKGAGHGMMDDRAMCDMHREMMASDSPSERQAIMDRKMQGKSAADKRKLMKKMDEHCK